MGVFGNRLKLNEARESGGGVFFVPKQVSPADGNGKSAVYEQGQYIVEVDMTKCFDNRKKETNFVCETIIRESNVAGRAPGSRCSWMIGVNMDAAASNIRSLMIALTGSALGRTLTSEEIASEDWDAIAEAAVSGNRFKGVKLSITAFHKLKKDKRPTGNDAAVDPSYFTMCLFNAVPAQDKAA